MPTFADLSQLPASEDLAFFIAGNLIWGLGLILFSILFSILSWKGMKGLFSSDGRGMAIALWLLNLGLLVAGIIMITKAFPRANPLLSFAILFVIFLAFLGGGVATKKKEEEDSKKEDKK